MRDLSVAVFRPDDERLADAVELLDSLGATAVSDPMLAVDPTDAVPRTDADYVVLTSKTGVELVAETDWEPGEATVCAIGPKTADAIRAAGYEVDIVPDEYTSSGLVAELESALDGARVEVARSDHGSPVLLDGFEAAGAYVHETVLYQLVRPEGSGESAERAAAGDLDAACFTSSLTVEHFLEAAAERDVRADALAGLEDATVGVIGEPTRETAAEFGIDVDLVASEATFNALARETVELLL
ncbi:uroporphyrinogen-III synthase [Natrialba magadii ATCC 43099]|uniref:Uroporphyrinogen-III synthase n=1 Tax=Natrialba magadii (strain ATCC 43099 / DSM 3394 / CCM 3739 / CIP 104546 / IAM 13178 / JCM 8861 / NBRC 102185 / NCIMB 2190 / MS3) TaxID=547559 RepID=D3SVH4_NATMM|nr:uroporphyrinogen-III synthase [Natrialba magadii]ADD05582.1 uroporphyrinogen-III synthase [Natrialba magadii ATCC 43099]ELY30005.1 uroporphyrinogen-III synthase [Natrialba magadii ATCC 43099]